MSDLDQYKRQAKRLADYLDQNGIHLRHTQALEAVSRIHGHRNYHALRAGARAPVFDAAPLRLSKWLDALFDTNAQLGRIDPGAAYISTTVHEPEEVLAVIRRICEAGGRALCVLDLAEGTFCRAVTAAFGETVRTREEAYARVAGWLRERDGVLVIVGMERSRQPKTAGLIRGLIKENDDARMAGECHGSDIVVVGTASYYEAGRDHFAGLVRFWGGAA